MVLAVQARLAWPLPLQLAWVAPRLAVMRPLLLLQQQAAP
jgi:hypothetical protein